MNKHKFNPEGILKTRRLKLRVNGFLEVDVSINFNTLFFKAINFI